MRFLTRFLLSCVGLVAAAIVVGATYSSVQMQTPKGANEAIPSKSPWELSSERPDCNDPYPLSGDTLMICVSKTEGWDEINSSARSGSLAKANEWSKRVPGSSQVFGGLRSSTLPCLRGYVLATAGMDEDETLPSLFPMQDASGKDITAHSMDVHGEPPRLRVGAGLFRVYTADVADTAGLVVFVGTRPVEGHLSTVGGTTAAVLFDGTDCERDERSAMRREAEKLLAGVQVRDTGCLDPSALFVGDGDPAVPLTQVCIPRIPGLSLKATPTDEHVRVAGGAAMNTVWVGSSDPALDNANPAAYLYVAILEEDVDDGLPNRQKLLEGEAQQEGALTWSCSGKCSHGYYYAKVLSVSKSQKVVVSVRCNASSTRSGVCSDSFARLVHKAEVLQ